MKNTLFLALLMLMSTLVSAQNTYYSQNVASSFTTNTDWNTAADGSGSNASPGDETLGTHNYIIQNTHTAVVDGNINVLAIIVGEGDLDGAGAGVGTGIMTIGDNTTARTVTVNGQFTVKAGAMLNIGAFDAIHAITILDDITVSTGQDNTGAASFNLFTTATRLANLTFGGTVTTIIAGQDITLADITFNGGQNRIINSGLSVNGNAQVSGAGTAVITSANHTILGNFTVDVNNSWTANTGITNFNGSSHQDITVNDVNGTASFYQVDFEFGGVSPNDKRIVGDILVTNRTRVFNSAVIDDDPGSAHSFQQFQIDGSNLCTFSNTSSVTFTGSEIRHGSGSGVDGDLQLGDASIIIAGNCSLERGDNFRINNSFNINSGYLVMNGVSDGSDESTITDLGANTFTVTSGARLYLRGADNFPTSFTTYSFQSTTSTYYDANFSQTVRGIAASPFDRLILSQAQDQSGGATKTLQTDIDVDENLYLYNGIILDFNAFNVSVAGNITNDDGATVTSASGNLTLDGEDVNQTISGGVIYTLGTGTFTIDHSSVATAIRRINIDINLAATDFTMTNTGGSTANYLIVDVDNFAILPTGFGTGTFSLGADVRYYTAGLSGGNDFATTVTQFGTTTLNVGSYIRFDGTGAQLIPNVTGGYGFIELGANGNKSATGNITAAADFSRVAGTPQFQDGGFTIRISGDWNMDDNYVDAGNMTGTIEFEGADQQISESEFNNVIFEGSGTKSIVGAIDLSGSMLIDVVTVNASTRNIDLAGGTWTETNGAVFTQTTGQTSFDGGALQAITQLSSSSFGDIILKNSSGILALSDITVADDFDFSSGSNSILLLNNNTLTIGGDWLLRLGSTFTGGGNSTLIFNGSTAQNLYNYVGGTSYDYVEFTNIGIKDLREQAWDVNRNFTIGSGATVDGNGIAINVAGDWFNSGAFQHNALVTFDGAAQSIGSSLFHDVNFAGSNTKTLAGNITCNGDFFINSTLNVSGSNYSITVEEDWTNNGTFTEQQGTVTINGGYSLMNTGGVGATKSFYNLEINVNSNTRAELTNDVDIDGDLTITSGQFRIRNYNMFLEGGLTNSGTLSQNTSTNITFDDDDSGTHSLDLGSSNIYHTTLNAGGATYQLTGNLTFQQDEPFDLVNGTLDLNGNTMAMGDGSDGSPNAVITMTGGTLIIDEGAVLKIHEGSTFTNSGGALKLLGVDGNPATLSVNGDAFFDYLQDNAAASFEAQFYVIASTNGAGIELQQGSIVNMSDGTFTSGSGIAYLTLNGLAVGTVSASNIIFNAGPTFNIDMTSGSGTISFVIAGGTLAGAAFENDSPPNGASTGFIRWSFPAGNTWLGTTSSDWHTGTNWSLGTVPTASDFVYLDSTVPPTTTTVNVTTSDAFAERVFITGTGMSLNLNGFDLTIANADSTEGNFTMQSGNTFAQGTLDTLYIAGSWSENGTYDISNSPTIAFIGTDGSHTISPGGTSAGDRFYDLYFNASSSANYTLGANTRVDNSITITGGTLDASSGFDIFLYGDWAVNGGFFNAGSARVNLDASNKTQNISGGTFNELYVDGSNTTKEINSNIAVAGTLRIEAAANVVLDGNDKTIFLAGTWDNDQGSTGFTQTGVGSVIFNGASQNINAGLGTTFNNIIFQGTGSKNVFDDIIVSGDASIISVATLDLEISGSMAGTGTGSFNMTDGALRIFDVNPSTNFPTGFGTYNLTGGRVDYLGDGTQDITGGLDYFDLRVYSTSAATPTTKNVTSDFTVNDDLSIGHGTDAETTLAVSDGVTITLVDNLSHFGGPQISWGTDGSAGGSLHHIDDASGWTIDADITGFNNLIIDGTGTKTMASNLTITGDMTIKTGSTFNMEAFTLVKGGAATINFVLEDGTTFDSEVLDVAGTAFATGFDSYTIHPSSITRIDGSSNQTVYSTPNYGILNLYSIGNATLDGNLDVEGNFDTNTNTLLVDGGNDINLAGSTIDIRNYTPSSSARTITFDGADQTIRNDESGTPIMELPIVVFSGTGTKTMIETLDINGNLSINPGITVVASRDIDFSALAWQNNGTFTHTSTTLPVTFSGVAAAQIIDPGANNSFGSLIFNNLFGTTTIANNGLNIENGGLTVNTNVTADFGALTHTIASNSFTIDGTWTTTNSNLTFDRAGTQVIPTITAQDIICATSGSKQLAGNWNIDDLTINAGVTLDVTTTDYIITLTGNWLNSGGVFTDREGTVAFESNDTNAKSITAGGSQFYNVTFNQVQTNTRTYTIPEATTFQEDLTIGNGATLDLNGQVLTLGNNDADDPPGEVHTIQAGGVLEVDAGAILQFECTDDNNNTTDIGATLNVNGTLNVVGVAGNVAIVTRSAGNNRIQIEIDPATGSTGTIGAQYYHFQYIYDDGIVLHPTATLDVTNNFSNGTWSNIRTGTGSGSQYYLQINTDNIGGGADINVPNVTFNFNGAPTISTHFNVGRTGGGLIRSITFQTVSNGLLAGASFEDDGNGQINWPIPTITTWLGTVDDDWYKVGNWSAGVPTNVLDAYVPLGQNIARIDPANGVGAICKSLQLQGDGILKLVSDGDLDIEGDIIVGSGTGTSALVIAHNSSEIFVQGSWSTVNPVVFDHGSSTVTFDATAGSVSVTPNAADPFYNLTFNGDAIFNIIGTSLDVDGNFTITDGIVTPSSSNYTYNVGGDFTRNTINGAVFTDAVDGTVILDGAVQTIRDMTFNDLTVDGSLTKTFESTNTIADDLVINSTMAAQNSGNVGTIDIEGDVTINAGGIFNDGNQNTHTFAGVNWIAGAGSFVGTGLITFDRLGSGQDIESVDGTAPEFSSVSFIGTGDVDLLADLNVTGDVTITNSINTFDCNTFIITNTSGIGVGTFQLENGEILYIEGANNFPADFAIYDLQPTSFTRYFGTNDQTIRGAFLDVGSNLIPINYGFLDFDHPNTKTLSGDIGVQSDLTFRESTLDVTAADYNISIGDDWLNNSGGSFLAQNGTVTFTGGIDQRINNNALGTKDFYNLTVDDVATTVDVDGSDLTILNNLTIANGIFTASGFTVNVGGNLIATNGSFATSGTYNLNTSNPTAFINTNGSILNNLSINADLNTRIYNVEDALSLNGNFTLNTGTFNGAGTSGFGKVVSLGNGADVVSIAGGIYQVGKQGKLELGSTTSLTVTNSGRIEIIGDASNIATVTRRTTGSYNFTIEDGTVAAQFYLFEYMATNGIFVNTNGLIDATDNFSNGTFANGSSGGTMLKIENTQTLNGGGRIENVSFPSNPGGGATNVYKNIAVSGDIEFYNASGDFAGEDFDQDPFDLIIWTFPPGLIWSGVVNSDWYNERNWVDLGGTDTEAIPDATTDATIPDPGAAMPIITNLPEITDDDPLNPGQFAVTQNLTVEPGAFITINSVALPTDDELTVNGDLTLDASSRLIMTNINDRLVVSGNWNKDNSALFTAGLGTVELNSTSGIKTLNNGSDDFYDLEINVNGTVQLTGNTTILNDLSISAGIFSLNSGDIEIGNDFTNAGTFVAGSMKTTFNPTTATTVQINSGGYSFFDLEMDDGGAGATFQLVSNTLTTDGVFDLTSGTLDPNGQTIILGDNIGIDNANIFGSLTIGANEILRLGSATEFSVKSGGTFNLVGTVGNLVTLENRSSGYYTFSIESGGNFGAQYYQIRDVDATGIYFKSGAVIDEVTNNLSNGSFSSGQLGGRYVFFENDFTGDFTASKVVFNSGPAVNARRLTGNFNITFDDASGVLAGSAFEDDNPANGDATGRIRWIFSNLITWTGTTNSDWNTTTNWDLGIVPVAANNIVIPTGLGTYPVLNSGSDGIGTDLTLQSGATMILAGSKNLDLSGAFLNSGTFTHTNGTLLIEGNWTNLNTYTAASGSTVQLDAVTGNILIETGGNAFCSLIINSDAAGDGDATFQTVDAITTNCGFNLVDGTFEVTNPIHTVTLNNSSGTSSFIINASATYTHGSGIVVLQTTGTGITVDINSNTIYDLQSSGSSTVTFSSNVVIANDFTLGTASDLGSVLVTLNGNLSNTAAFNANTGSFIFNGSSLQTITSTVLLSFNNLTIDNSFGVPAQITLNDDIEITGTLTLTDGVILTTTANVLHLNNGTLSGGSIASYIDGPFRRTGDGDFTFPIGAGSFYARLGLESIPGSDNNEFDVQYFDAVAPNQGNITQSGGPLNHVSGEEYWVVTQGNGISTPNVRLYWEDGTRSDIQTLLGNDLVVAWYNGSNWESKGQGSTLGTIATGSVLSANTFNSFSPITLGSAFNNNALPIELISFEAEPLKQTIKLSWETASEINNDYFTLLRSKDGENFNDLVTIIGAGTSTIPIAYTFVDERPYQGLSYYKLLQTDFDGTEVEVGLVLARMADKPGELVISSYPNPVSTKEVNINVAGLNNDEMVPVVIIDEFGKYYYQEKHQADDSGYLSFVIDKIGEWGQGIYILQIRGEKGVISTKLIKL